MNVLKKRKIKKEMLSRYQEMMAEVTFSDPTQSAGSIARQTTERICRYIATKYDVESHYDLEALFYEALSQRG